MDGWPDGWFDRWMYGLMDGLLDGNFNEWVVRCVVDWMDGRENGQMDD
jgi:hypothetical protein